MSRPSIPKTEQKVRVNLSLDKSVYKNLKNSRVNISRLANSLLSIYAGGNKWTHGESNPESLPCEGSVLPFDYAPIKEV